MPEHSRLERLTTSKTGLGRLFKAVFAKPDGGQLLVALLLCALGFGAVMQVRVDDEDLLEHARQTDLVQMLSDLNQRSGRLEEEIAELEATRRELASGAADEQAVLEQTAARSRQLAVLAGSAEATGPGVVVTIADPDQRVHATHLLTAIGELRVAGAEAIQIAGANGNVVRVVNDTYFLNREDEVLVVDGLPLTRPYVITAIGDPGALSESVEFAGGTPEIVEEAVVVEYDTVVVDALREPAEPEYARPAPDEEDDDDSE